DMTAESAAAAREAALLAGQRRALERLLLRLALPADVAGLPALDDAEITEMVHDFEVESERASAVRYLGTLAFRLRAAPVRRLLEGNGIRFAETVSKPLAVLPILTADGTGLLWDDANAWLAAWAARPPAEELVPLVVPLGDLGDIAAIDAAAALAGDAARLAAVAARYGAGDTLVAEARLEAATAAGGATALDLVLRRYGPDGPGEAWRERLESLDAAPEALFAQAVERAAALVQDAWKRQNMVSFGQEQALNVTAPIEGLSDWIELNRRLGDIATVRRVELLYLARDEARLDLVFVGDRAQLERALTQQDLSLAPADAPDAWVLRLPSAPPPAPSPDSQPTPFPE
ncbi:MAG TPA: DUF2066 domain-containing protein, partial [Dongiaceae bacterium]|nr:DUF2066 domain-containing protein [Dongiaceae bacterium]